MINIIYLLRKERRELKIITSIVLGIYSSLLTVSMVRDLGAIAILLSIMLTCSCIYTVITICELPYIFMWLDYHRQLKIVCSILLGTLLPLMWVYFFLLPLIEVLFTSTLTMIPIALIGFLMYGLGIIFDLSLHIYMKKRGLK